MSKPKRLAEFPKLNFSSLESDSSKPVSPRKYELSRYTMITDSRQNKYKLDFRDLVEGRLLGSGQFGVVSEMYHKPSNLTFAVKRIEENSLNDSDGTSSNGNGGEKDIMDLLVPMKIGDYKHLVKFYGALHAEGSYWILTELMDTSLDGFYKKAFECNIEMSELFLSKVAYAVLSGLSFMKSKGFIHRDVKPSNILINRQGDIKLCDFGISQKLINSISKTINKGCRPYMPPEKINDELSKNGYTIKSDVWSLGISMIEIATAVHPYENLHFWDQAKAIVEGPSPQLNSSKFSSAFCNFVDICLKKNEADRLKPNELLKHEWIKQYASDVNDVELIRCVVEKINAAKC